MYHCTDVPPQPHPKPNPTTWKCPKFSSFSYGFPNKCAIFSSLSNKKSNWNENEYFSNQSLSKLSLDVWCTGLMQREFHLSMKLVHFVWSSISGWSSGNWAHTKEPWAFMIQFIILDPYFHHQNPNLNILIVVVVE